MIPARFLKLALLALLAAAPAFAQSDNELIAADLPVDGLPVREAQPISLSVTFGTPSPAWVGALIGWQWSSFFQITAGAGYFRTDEIRIGSVAASARFYPFPTLFSPFAEAGGALYFVSGNGAFQGLEADAMGLFLASVGLDGTFRSGLRLAAGVRFHFPVQLIFPFAELGISF